MGRTFRAMVATKNPADAERIMQLLAKENQFLAQKVHKPEKVIEYDRSLPLDLLICEDELSSETSGRELASELRKQNQHVRCLIITDDRSLSSILSTTTDGMTKFLCTPYKDEELKEYVRILMAYASTNSDRRDHQRHISTIETRCWLINPFGPSKDEDVVSCMTRDISRSGISLLTHQLIPVPMMIKVEMAIPGQTSPITQLGKTLSSTMTPIPDVYRVGVKFIGLLPREIDQLLDGIQLDEKANDDEFYLGNSYITAVKTWLDRHRSDWVDQLHAQNANGGDKDAITNKTIEELMTEIEKS